MIAFIRKEGLFILIGSVLGFLGFIWLLNPADSSQLQVVKQQIDSKKQDVEFFAKQPKLSALDKNWQKVRALALFFDLELQEDKKQQFKGAVPSQANAYFAVLSGDSKQVAIATYILEQHANVVVQSIKFSNFEASASLAVLGRA